MKILMVTMSMGIGGAETHILELCRELASRGHDITLVSNGGVYADELSSCGVRNVILPLHTKNPSSVLASYRGLEKLILAEKFDIVHAHARIPAFIIGLLCDRLDMGGGRKFRFVTSAHLNFTVNPLWRAISRWGDRVMAVSDDIAKYLTDEYGYPSDKISVTVNGIDTNRFSPDTDFSHIIEKYGLDPTHRRIVYMSRLDADRAQPAFRLAECAESIARKHPDTDIIIVGGGSEYEKLSAIADKVNSSSGRKIITLTGGVSNTDEFCACADVFIGVSRSALEAMSSARPVILAGGQGALGVLTPDILAEAEKTNFCCRGCNNATSAELEGWIDSLLALSDEKRREIGGFNREYIRKNYAAARMADDYCAMYEKAMRSPVQFRGSPDITLSGYYGFGNLGDESLLDIISARLCAQIPDVKIAALTHNPKAEAKRTGLKCVGRYAPLSAVHNISKSKLLISGGGSLLQDATSSRSLRYYTGIMEIAHMTKTKICVLANGIGPINKSSDGKAAAHAVKSAEFISVRDTSSASLLVKLGISEERIRVSADPAYLIGAEFTKKTADFMSANNLSNGSFFIVSARPLTRAGKKNKNECTSDDIALADRLSLCAERISSECGLTPVLVPMQKAQDSDITEEIRARLEKNGINAAVFSPSDAPELIGLMSRSSFVIGMRLHSIILASSAGIPVIGISYDPKVRSLMAELGQKYCIGAEESGAADFTATVSSHAGEILAHREEIGNSLSAKADEMRQRSAEDFRIIAEMLGLN